jgi:hypothetical protein
MFKTANHRTMLAMTGALIAMAARTLERSSAPSTPYARLQTYNKPIHDRRTSRYMPHQGERECARRRAQMLKAKG